MDPLARPVLALSSPSLAALAGRRRLLRRRQRLDDRRRRRRVRRGRERHDLARRLLDPAGRLRRAHPGLPEDRRRQGRRLQTSFGASGDQSRAVEAGLPADVVAFSLEPDIERLVDAGHRRRRTGPTRRTRASSRPRSSSFIVRKGNPKGIKTWDDLLKPGVEVLTPNPFTSGAAKWNLLAAYGQASSAGKDPQAGPRLRREAPQGQRQGPGQVRAARRCRPSSRGKGDVLLSYENEAIDRAEEGRGRRLRHPGRHDPDREPDRGRRRRRRTPTQAKAFVDYVLSDAGQTHLRRAGATGRSTRRSLAANAAKFPEPVGPVHDRRPRRLGDGQQGVLRPRERLDREDRGGAGVSTEK